MYDSTKYLIYLTVSCKGNIARVGVGDRHSTRARVDK